MSPWTPESLLKLNPSISFLQLWRYLVTGLFKNIQ